MRIKKDESILVVIDVQERLFPHIHEHEMLLKKIETLVKGIQLLEVPYLFTEQYVKGLGATLPALQPLMGERTPPEKMTFSCCGDPAFMLMLEEDYKETTLLCGIESHVCVLQTAIDLRETGRNVVVVADAVSSRHPFDKAMALERMKAEGIRLATVESLLFELCVEAGSDTFKGISRLVK